MKAKEEPSLWEILLWFGTMFWIWFLILGVFNIMTFFDVGDDTTTGGWFALYFIVFWSLVMSAYFSSKLTNFMRGMEYEK